ncbi:helix-turn-helix domain-containing protein [Pseudoponticoccus marisrubri]|uniref:Plasmid replication protein C N-terminal domain-containing protein n=1 Tax=Pseudoponticoccus marisrubri TaxID=1685382 RepID=A0A0W7WJY4_9RHOB|nr:helix-turn-helix domain-containing protein [Pseudoponticoccus marisrubri]KUF10792.1 hypothetical protein AVJ23_10150 [Pseudoponticoccus marisrubri]
MEHTRTAALRVAAQSSCAEERPGEAPCPTERIAFAPIDRWAFLDLVVELRRILKLTTNDIAVLRALLSFLPVRSASGREGPVTPDTLTIIFASNAAIAKRAGGMDDRVLRHAFRRLVSAGLIARRDSATGKRFPVRQGGRIVSAYGLDLAPGLAMAPALQRRAETERDAADRVRAARAELFARRRQLLDRAQSLCATAKDWLDTLSKVLRRKLSPEDLDGLRAELSRIEEDVAPSADAHAGSLTSDKIVDEPCDSPGRDGQIYRHSESKKIDKKKKGPTLNVAWQAWSEIQSMFPIPPQTMADLRDIVCTLAEMLRIRPEALGEAAAHLGWVGVGDVLNAITERVTEIRNPTAYLLSIVRDWSESGTATEPRIS